MSAQDEFEMFMSHDSEQHVVPEQQQAEQQEQDMCGDA